MRILLLLISLIFLTNSYCQNITITIRDSLTNLPIPRVYLSTNLNIGVLSDEKGNFLWDKITYNAKILKINSIGYFEKIINIKKIPENGIIYLTPSYAYLNEVTVFSDGNSIVKKALNKLKSNYPSKPFKLKGLYRIQNNDNVFNYHFESDALVEYFINPNDKKNKINTVVLKNESKQNRSPNLKWYGYAIYRDPIINQKMFFNQRDLLEYNFTNYGKLNYNGRVTYNIALETKKDKNTFGTLFIDSISGAFVKIHIEYLNPPKIAFKKKIIYGKLEYEYKEIENKWYLKKFNTTTQHKNYNTPSIISDFFTTEINNSNYNLPNENYFINNNTENDKIKSIHDSVFNNIEIKTLEDTSNFRIKNIYTNLITIDKYNDTIINKKEYNLQEKKILEKNIPISRSGYGINILQPYNIDPTLGLYIESKNIYNFRLGLGYNNNFKFTKYNQSSILVDLYYSKKINEANFLVIHPLIQFQKFYGNKNIENATYAIKSHVFSCGIKINCHIKTDRLLSGKLTYNLPYSSGNSTLDKNSINFSIVYTGILY